MSYLFFPKIFKINFKLDFQRGREREREKRGSAASCTALQGIEPQTRNGSDWESNWPPFGARMMPHHGAPPAGQELSVSDGYVSPGFVAGFAGADAFCAVSLPQPARTPRVGSRCIFGPWWLSCSW